MIPAQKMTKKAANSFTSFLSWSYHRRTLCVAILGNFVHSQKSKLPTCVGQLSFFFFVTEAITKRYHYVLLLLPCFFLILWWCLHFRKIRYLFDIGYAFTCFTHSGCSETGNFSQNLSNNVVHPSKRFMKSRSPNFRKPALSA